MGNDQDEERIDNSRGFFKRKLGDLIQDELDYGDLKSSDIQAILGQAVHKMFTQFRVIRHSSKRKPLEEI